MNDTSALNGLTLPPALATRVDALCTRFEAAWKSGERPRLEEYLVDMPEAGQVMAAVELLRVEAHYRRRAGETPDPSDYVSRVPMLDPSRLAWALTPVVLETTLRAPAMGRVGVRDEPIVPGYELLGMLGRGGMGVVYKARHVTLNRTVALKMIRTGDDASPAELNRFRREAEAAARLQHPNVVQVYEVGEWRGSGGDDPQPYIALEYVSGGSLADAFRGSLQPPHAIARVIETVARALAHVHAQGIIHRDLKPANILMAVTDGGPPVPKITDFGLAKLTVAGHMTQTGMALGTPSYMAPEQIDASSPLIGPATDVYGLGAILYEALTGRPPFKAETPMATMMHVRHVEPVAPHLLEPTVPRDLETICLKCLAKDPGRRYGSAQSLAEDLARFQAGEPIRARPAGAAASRPWPV